jgi:glycosyltransferase involved in cell wall biosynthesis
LIERKVVNRADGLFFTCEEELRMAKKSFKPYKPVQEINVGLGIIEPPAYDSKMRRAFLEKCPGLNSPYLLFLSRIHEKKGVDILIKAYSELAKKMAEVNAEVPMAGLSTGLYEEQDYIRHELPKLVIAGPGGETSYGKKIQKIVLDHPQLCNSVFFPGMLSGDSKWGAFYGCEAFVLPSHQENFGIAVVEALACSKPVLISSQVNIWREIEAGGAGIVAANSQQETGEMLSNWLNLSVDVKEEMRLHARACYINHFAIARAARRMLEAVVD